jgi:hypothetical protein
MAGYCEEVVDVEIHVLTALSVKNMSPCSSVLLDFLLDSENGGGTFLRIVSGFIQDCAGLHSRRQQFSRNERSL